MTMIQKRFLTLVLALVMIIGLLPTEALADNQRVYDTLDTVRLIDFVQYDTQKSTNTANQYLPAADINLLGEASSANKTTLNWAVGQEYTMTISGGPDSTSKGDTRRLTITLPEGLSFVSYPGYGNNPITNSGLGELISGPDTITLGGNDTPYYTGIDSTTPAAFQSGGALRYSLDPDAASFSFTIRVRAESYLMPATEEKHIVPLDGRIKVELTSDTSATSPNTTVVESGTVNLCGGVSSCRGITGSASQVVSSLGTAISITPDYYPVRTTWGEGVSFAEKDLKFVFTYPSNVTMNSITINRIVFQPDIDAASLPQGVTALWESGDTKNTVTITVNKQVYVVGVPSVKLSVTIPPNAGYEVGSVVNIGLTATATDIAGNTLNWENRTSSFHVTILEDPNLVEKFYIQPTDYTRYNWTDDGRSDYYNSLVTFYFRDKGAGQTITGKTAYITWDDNVAVERFWTGAVLRRHVSKLTAYGVDAEGNETSKTFYNFEGANLNHTGLARITALELDFKLDYGWRNTLNNGLFLEGRWLKPGGQTARFHCDVWDQTSLEDDENAAPDYTATATATGSISTRKAAVRLSWTKKLNTEYNLGDTVSLGYTLTAETTSFPQTTTQTCYPKLFLAVPTGASLQNVQLTNGNATIPFTVSNEPVGTDANGWPVYEISLPTPFPLGQTFKSGAAGGQLTVTWDLKLGISMKIQKLNVADLLYVYNDLTNGTYHTAVWGGETGITNPNPLSGKINVNAPPRVSIDAAIRMEGESAWYTYDAAAANSIASFAPGKNGQIKLTVYNNTDYDQDVSIYVPLPQKDDYLGEKYHGAYTPGFDLYLNTNNIITSADAEKWTLAYAALTRDTANGSLDNGGTINPPGGTWSSDYTPEANMAKLTYYSLEPDTLSEVILNIKSTGDETQSGGFDMICPYGVVDKSGDENKTRDIAMCEAMAAEMWNGSLSGFVFQDANRNGVMDSGEAPEKGVQITISWERDGKVNSRTATNGTGAYEFVGLQPDKTYSITANNPYSPNPAEGGSARRFVGMEDVTEAEDESTASRQFTLNSAEGSIDTKVTGQDFGLMAPLKVSYEIAPIAGEVIPTESYVFPGETVGTGVNEVSVVINNTYQFAKEWIMTTEEGSVQVPHSQLLDQVITKDTTFTALTDTVPIKVTAMYWDAEQGEMRTLYNTTVMYGETVRYEATEGSEAPLFPDNSTVNCRPGFTFKGWMVNGDAENILTYKTIIRTPITGDVNYVAKYEPNHTAMTIEAIDDQIYTGGPITPALTVKVGDTTLTAEDYAAVYGDNISAGTATVTVHGIGKYADMTQTAAFTIQKAGQTVRFAKGTQDLAATYGDTFGNSAEAALDNAKISYASSDTSVAVVDANGTLTILKAGTVTITASAAETGNVKAGSAGYTLTIQKAAPTLAFEKSVISVKATEAVSNTLTVAPAGLSIRYASDNGNVAEVDASTGSVTLTKQAGVATVTADFAGDDRYEKAQASYTIVVSSDQIAYTAAGYTGIYDGTAHGITVTVTSPGSGASVTCGEEGSSFTNAGTYTVSYTIAAPGYDTVTGSAVVEIKPAEITDATVADGVYAAEPIEGRVSGVKAGDLTLTANDYTVTYSNNTSAGTATATITGKGNFTGTLVKTFAIARKPLTDAMVTGPADQLYTGSEITPGVTVEDGNHTMTQGLAYIVSYENNVKPGTATVIVTGIGNYTGTVEKTFQITSTGAFTVIVDNTALTYDGTAKSPTVLVFAGSKLLTAGEDYTISGNSAVNAGSHEITITGIYSYKDYTQYKTSFTISPANRTAAFAQSVVGRTYGDAAFTNVLTITPTGDSPTTTYTTGDSNVATVDVSGKVTITGAGTTIITAVVGATQNYNAASASFTLTAAPKTGFSVADVEAQRYTGRPITPAFTVTAGSVTLTENVDYTVTYENNIAVGTARATITGKGNYSGTVEKNFAIVANEHDFVIAAVSPQTYNGSAHTPAPEVTYANKTLQKDVDYTLSYTGNINAGTATITVTGKEGTAYAGVTGAITFTIQPKALQTGMIGAIPSQNCTGSQIRPNVTVKDGATTLILNTDYTLTYADNINVGTDTAKAMVTGRGNYTGTVTATFSIISSGLTVAPINPQQYTGQPIAPTVVVRNGTTTLTKGVDYEVDYENNVNVGTATAKITFKGAYAGTPNEEKAFQIVSKKICLTVDADPQRAEVGEDVTVSVKLDDTDLTKTTDYTLSYQIYGEDGALKSVEDMDAVGTYVITAIGTGEYAGASGTTTFVRLPHPASDFVLEGLEGGTYVYEAGVNRAPDLNALMVKDQDGTTLTLLSDYNVKYALNGTDKGAITDGTKFTDVGLYVVTIAGVRFYEGSASVVAIAITPKDISSEDVSVSIPSADYDGQPHAPAVSVKDGEQTLNGKDYTAAMASGGYTDANGDGYVITLSGKGNYTGVREERFVVNKAIITVSCTEQTMEHGQRPPSIPESAITITGLLDKDKEQVAVTLVPPTDLSVGTHDYTASLSGLRSGNYTVICSGAKLAVTQRAAGGMRAQLQSDKALYTGQKILPVVIATDSETGAALTEGKDYTLTCSPEGLTEPGVYEVTVTGTGGYTDVIKLTFTIEKSGGNGGNGGGGGGGGSSTVTYTIQASAGRGGVIDPGGNISVARGSDKHLTIRTDLGYIIQDVLVDGESVGAVDHYTFQDVRANHTISVIFTESAAPLADPSQTGVSVWLETDAHNSYLYGYGSGLFGPTDNMTRAQAAQMFYSLLARKDVPITVSFVDVEPEAWYATAVETLGSLGIIVGVGDGCFAPDRPITRAEFAVIAMRFANQPATTENCFSDVNGDEWYAQAVNACARYGWTTGYSDGTFRALNNITRAEVTTLTNRVLGRRPDKDAINARENSLPQFEDVSRYYWAYYEIMEATNTHGYTRDEGTERWK